jgi:hypothetical protein
MNCDKIKSLVGWFHDGELNAADARLVAEHLDHCPDCVADLAGLRELDRASRNLAKPIVPADLWDGIASRLPLSAGGINTGQRRLVARRSFLVAAGMAAAGIITGVVVYGRARRGMPKLIGPPAPGGMERSDPIPANLAMFGPEDRRLVEEQRICIADGCGARLGEGGPPRKVVLQNQPVFLCCEGCEQWARAHPAEALAKLNTLEHRHDKSGKEP